MTSFDKWFVRLQFKGGAMQTVRVRGGETAAREAMTALEDPTHFARVGDRIITPADVTHATLVRESVVAA